MNKIQGVLLTHREYNILLNEKYASEKLQRRIVDLEFQVKDIVKPTNNLATLEKRTIVRVVRFCRGNRNESSKILGIPERTLYRKLAVYQKENEK